MRLYDLEIVTPERSVLRVKASFMILRSVDGDLGILGGHTPLITALVPTPVDVRLEDGQTFFAVSGGFLEVRPDKVTVLARTAEAEDQIDAERAEAALERAEAMIAEAGPDVDLARAKAAAARAAARLKTLRLVTERATV